MVTYLEVSNSFSLGGTYIEGVSGAESCKTWCTAREECGAFDINGANECYWHNNGDWENQLQVGDTSVKQYRKLPCGTGSPTASVTVLVTGTLVLEEYFTVRKRSCGKVMVFFLHLSVILFTGGRCTPPRADPRDGHCSGRYASHWNAFFKFDSLSDEMSIQTM